MFTPGEGWLKLFSSPTLGLTEPGVFLDVLLIGDSFIYPS